MIPCFVCHIITPKKYQLDGLWFGTARSKCVIIFVHGLAGSAFFTGLATSFVTQSTSVLTFNNRGHDKISKLYHLTKNRKGHTSSLCGEAHEVFTDCADDIAGAVNFAKGNGVREIFLAGHSTGCQKSVYYLHKTDDRRVRGLILLAPLSDYAGALKFDRDNKLARVTALARKFVKQGKPHGLLPHQLCGDVLDAQRFLSLYTPDSKEEIFCYAQQNKPPIALQKTRVPLLVILAANDEYGDRPAVEIGEWFAMHARNSHIKIVPDALHGFQGKEAKVAGLVRAWLKEV